MGKKSLSQAKNDIRTCLIEIVDPSPNKSERDRLRGFFNHRCAYCGTKINQKSRKGHLDHLTAKKKGFNHISNRVLACSRCNGDDKRENPWRTFINSKGTKREIQTRISKIEQWAKDNEMPVKEKKGVKELRKIALAHSKHVCDLLEEQAKNLRKKISPKTGARRPDKF